MAVRHLGHEGTKITNDGGLFVHMLGLTGDTVAAPSAAARPTGLRVTRVISAGTCTLVRCILALRGHERVTNHGIVEESGEADVSSIG